MLASSAADNLALPFSALGGLCIERGGKVLHMYYLGNKRRVLPQHQYYAISLHSAGIGN